MRTVSIFTNKKTTHLHRQVAKYIIKINIIINMETQKLQFHYCIPKKTKSIKTLTTVFQSGISLESVKHAHLPIECLSPLCC